MVPEGKGIWNISAMPCFTVYLLLYSQKIDIHTYEASPSFDISLRRRLKHVAIETELKH